MATTIEPIVTISKNVLVTTPSNPLFENSHIPNIIPAIPEADNVDFEKLKWREKLKYLKDNVTVEPLLACYVMPSVLSSLAVQNMNLQKACKVNLRYSEEICTALIERRTENFTVEEIQVQTLVANMNVWKTALQCSIPALLIVFLGSWSDRNARRKPIMLLPIIGEFLTTIGLIFCTYYFDEWPMEIAGLIEAIFPAMTGGWMTMFMAIFSYMADITTVESRTFRIGVVNVFVSLGIPIGTALSGILYKKIGFYGIFSISVVFYLCGFYYGLFYLKEAKRIETCNTKTSTKSGILDFINPKHVGEAFRVVTKKREGNKKSIIILLLIVFSVVVGPIYGETAVSYLFARYRFNWDEVDFSFYITYAVIINLIGTVFTITIFSRLLKFEDTIIGILACLSKIAGSFVYAFSTTPFMFYIGPLVDIVSGAGVIAMRSLTTKIVASNEQGKIHAVFGVCEAIVPLIYNPMYSLVYVKTLKTIPGAFFILGAILTVPAIFIFMYMHILQKRDLISESGTVNNAVNTGSEKKLEIPP